MYVDFQIAKRDHRIVLVEEKFLQPSVVYAISLLGAIIRLFSMSFYVTYLDFY